MWYQNLVVDDIKLARMSVAKLLNSLRPTWTRLEAANAEEALALMRLSPADLALVDFNMPERDGLHLAADLRAVSKDIPLAVVSANSQKEVVDRAAAVGAEFLTKPLTEQLLRDFLEAAEAKLTRNER